MRPNLSETLRPFVDLLYPPRCPLCGEGVGEQTGLCAECWSGLVIPGEPSCGSCQRPLAPSVVIEQAVCAACLASPPIHCGIAAGTIYNDTSRHLVLKFKYGRKIAMAPLLARVIHARLGAVEESAVFVPVPLHWTRLWHRGFNQAALLAQELARLSGRRTIVDGLIRRKRTKPLGGLGRAGRRRVLSGAIAVNPKRTQQIAGRRVILVDDVLTSGATSHASVRALKRAGAEAVSIACFARVLDEIV